MLLFTRPTDVSENVVTELMFPYLCKIADYDRPRLDEEGLAWLFLHLYDLLTDWQNIIREVERRLAEAVSAWFPQHGFKFHNVDLPCM